VTAFVGSLSTRVFETRTATGSELFSLLTCPHTTTFTLLSIVSSLEMNSIKIWETIRSKTANCSVPVAVRVSKTRVLKLPITVNTCVTFTVPAVSFVQNGSLMVRAHRNLYRATWI